MSHRENGYESGYESGCACASNSYLDIIDELVAAESRRHAGLDSADPRERLIPRLQAIQDRYHHLPEDAIAGLSQRMNIPANEIVGVASFYRRFRFRPAGRHAVKVCVGTACHVKGAEAVFDAFRGALGLSGDEDTDASGEFSVVKVACLGCCMLAPAVQIGERTYGFVKKEEAGLLLEDFRRRRSEEAAPAGTATNADVDVLLCRCSSCVGAGAADVQAAIEDAIRSHRLPMKLRSVGCTGLSYQAPYFEIHVGGKLAGRYGRVRPEDAESILLAHDAVRGRGLPLRHFANRVTEFILRPEREAGHRSRVVSFDQGPDRDYVDRQRQIATEHSGLLDPLSIGEYRAVRGFEILDACSAGMSKEKILRGLASSGLRGRGGAGFPTARKWETVDANPDPVRYVICNADEGDPGAFMDRLLLESFPFRVLEGIAVAAYTLRSSAAYIYVRSEYGLAVARIREAIRLAEDAGLWGPKASNPLLRFVIEPIEGAGAFVCGEETALLAALEGGRGIPRTRPPYPAESGFRGRPTLINNVETFALVPWILRSALGAFAEHGTAGSRGTKTFALAGKIRQSGLIEVPMGITIREIVETIGGGMQEGSVFKAVQIGGPSGGCLPESLADAPVDYDSLQGLGAIMGSGGLVVLDQRDCMVELARYFTAFAVDESCGRCAPCRVGTRRLLELLELLVGGRATAKTLGELEALALFVREGARCGLGRSCVNPILSGLRSFADEYRAHVEGRCPSLSCKALIRYEIDQVKCIGCTRCAQACGSKAIEALPLKKHSIDQELCIKCGSCAAACPRGAAHAL